MTTALVRDLLPEVYADLEAMFEAEGDSKHRELLPALTVTESSGCGDAFCASFYTGARPTGAWSDEGSHQTLAEAYTVVVNAVDVIDSVIRYVEIISAETEAGQRVDGALRRIGAVRP